MAAFGVSAVVAGGRWGCGEVRGSCSALAPGLDGVSVAEGTHGRACRWTMITRKQRRLRKEAKRKRQEAKDEAVFVRIDEIVENLREGYFDELMEQMEDIHNDESLNEPMCNYLASSLAKHVPAPKGLEYVKMVLREQAKRDVPYRTATYNTMIKACALQGSYEQSKWWYDQMVEIGIRRDLACYNQMLLAAASAGDIAKLEDCWVEMQADGKKGSVGTYSALIKAYDLKNDLRGVRGAYRRMKENGVVPTWFTYDSLIKVYGRNGQFDLVESVLKDMERNDTQPDARVFARIIRLCADAGDANAVDWWLKRMLTQRTQDPRETYSMMVQAYVIADDMPGAEKVLGQMVEAGFRPHLKALNSMMEGYAKRGDVAASKRILVRLHQHKILGDTWTFNRLLELMRSKDDVRGAEAVYQGMLRKGVAPNMNTFTYIVSLYSKHRLHEKVLQVLDTVLQFGMAPSQFLFTSCAEAMIACGRLERAPELLMSVSREPEIVKVVQAVALLETMVARGMKPVALLRSMQKLSIPVTVEVATAVLQYLSNVGDKDAMSSLVAWISGIGVELPAEILEAHSEGGTSLAQMAGGFRASSAADVVIVLPKAAVLDLEDEDEVDGSGNVHEESILPPDALNDSAEGPARDAQRHDDDDDDAAPLADGVEEPDELDEEDGDERAVRNQLYRCLVVSIETDFDALLDGDSLGQLGLDGSWGRTSYTPMKKVPRVPKLDFQIMPRRSELIDDAGK